VKPESVTTRLSGGSVGCTPGAVQGGQNAREVLRSTSKGLQPLPARKCKEVSPVIDSFGKVKELPTAIVRMRELLSASMGGTIQLRTVLESDLWPALVDPTQLESIFLNLAINARDAMQWGATLTLKTSNAVIHDTATAPQEPAPGEYVELAVIDTGSGIPADVLPRVFEPFFTTKEPGKGSGLGLSQVFGVAKQSGGGIRIETRVGEGTAVKVYFPRGEFDLSDCERERPEPDLSGRAAEERASWSSMMMNESCELR
jgi:signal transduction histidine kinase